MAKAIDYFSYDNPFLKVKTYWSLKARNKMFSMFIENCNPSENDKVLDLGATPDEKLADSNFFEELYPYKRNITVASIEDCHELVEKYGLERFVFNVSKQPLPFEDSTFDIVFSSAVLEHVGTRTDQSFFINECLRVIKPGGKIFLTTPNRWFPLELHTFIPFLHWLPWPIFQEIVRRVSGDFWADINNLNLLSKRDLLSMSLSKPIRVEYVRTCGINSNIIVVRR